MYWVSHSVLVTIVLHVLITLYYTSSHERRLALGMEYDFTLAKWRYVRDPEEITERTLWMTRPDPPDAGPYIAYEEGQYWSPFLQQSPKGHVCKTKAAGSMLAIFSSA